MTVFPGGGVDAADVPDPDAWVGPDPRWWGTRLQCPPELAGALVHAAVRETFEECGVLLAAPRAADAPPPDPGWLDAARDDLVAHRRPLGALLADGGLVLRADLLRPWARWITPAARPRRYDTVFFVTPLPAGQQADAHTTEAVEATWWYPAEALEQRERGEIQLMAPTMRTLQEIAEHPDSAAVLDAAQRREIRPINPRLVRRDGEVRIVLPDEPDVAVISDLPVDRSTDRPTDRPADRPADLPVDRSTDRPTDRPADRPTDRPADLPVDRPVDLPVDRPT